MNVCVLSRITRNSANTLPALRSKSEFDWASILSTNPEKMFKKERSVGLPITRVDNLVPENSNKLVVKVEKVKNQIHYLS